MRESIGALVLCSDAPHIRDSLGPGKGTVRHRVHQIDPFQTALGDRYRFERELGRGGMATVYLAEDTKHRRSVAIKVLRPEIASGIGAARFLREIAITSRLTHPNLLTLHDSGEIDGLLYYVMPYLEGETLRARLDREKQLSLEESLRIFRDVAAGLGFAHRRRVVHRDLKPENILLHEGRAILADFGIARALTASAADSLTSSGLVIGTVWYMSPEQGSGSHELDARSDVYSLGCVVFEMLAGEPPFTGRNPQAVIARHISEALPSLRVVRPDVPEALEQVIRRALAKAPEDRYGDADAFANAVRAGQEAPTTTGVAGAEPRPVGRAIRLGVVIAVIGLALVALLLANDWIATGGMREDDWLLVADFEGPADDPGLADAMRDLVTASLEQSKFLRVVPRRQLAEVMRRADIPETTHVDVDLGRQLALRSSVRAVLFGSVQRLGTSDYSVALYVVGTEGDAQLASSARATSGERLVAEVEVAALDVRAQLGERRDALAAQRPLYEVATPSFEAFRRYVEALDLVVTRVDLAGSNALLADAIALDSGFASAWASLGANYATARQLDSARFAYGRALALPSRLSPAQLYRLRGDVAYVLDHDLPSAVRWYDLHLEERPHSIAGRSNRAVYLSALGRYVDAVADLRSAVDELPFGPELAQPTVLNLAAMLVATGQLAEAERVAQQLTGPSARYVEILLAMARSEWAAAERLGLLAARDTLAPLFLRIHAITSQASAGAARGAIDDADSVLRAAAAGSRGASARWYERARLLLAMASGQAVRSRDDVVAGDTTVAATMLRALWAAAAGDTIAARAGLAEMRTASGRARAELGAGPQLIEGWIAAHGRRWRAVTDTLAPIARAGEHDPTLLDRPDNFHLRWLVASAYEQLERPDSAATYLRLLLDPTRMPPGHYALRGLVHAAAERRLAALR